jgi:hypothetical protein
MIANPTALARAEAWLGYSPDQRTCVYELLNELAREGDNSLLPGTSARRWHTHALDHALRSLTLPAVLTPRRVWHRSPPQEPAEIHCSPGRWQMRGYWLHRYGNA